MKKHALSHFSIFLKGMVMGIADIIPGVSGGTIAIITGVYEEFLSSLNNLDLNLFKSLIKGNIKVTWDKYNLSFLSTLLLGIITSMIILSHYITYLINEHPVPLWSFFFGLILSGIFVLIRDIKNWNSKKSRFIFSSQIYLMIIGCSIALLVQTINPGHNQINYVYLFICGMISITAMLLPGVSGAYILVLLGAYETLLITFKEVVKFNSDYFLNFLSFVLGALLSVKLFSKFLTWSYKNHKNNTLSCLIGFMIGSLPSLWPWKINTFSNELFLSNLYIPNGFLTNIGFRTGLLFMIIGIMAVLILEHLSKKNAKSK
jgi:putative membrane protein